MKSVEEEMPCPTEALIPYKNWAHRNLWTKTKLTNRSHKQFTQNWNETVQKMGCSCIMLSLIKKVNGYNLDDVYNVIHWY